MGHWVHGRWVRRTKYIGRGRYLSYWVWKPGYYVRDHNSNSQFQILFAIAIIIIGLLVVIKLYF